MGVVLRAYPPAFRAHYAHDILVTLRDQRRALGSVQSWATTAFWVRALIDLLRSAATERICDARDRGSLARDRVARRCVGILLVGFTIGNVIYDVAEPKLRMGAFAMLLTALSGLTGFGLLRRRRPASQAG